MMCLFLNRDRSDQAHPVPGGKISLTGMIFILSAFALFLHACEPAGGIKERESMSVIKKNSTASVANQPVDAPEQAGIKTATFALG